jgi:hypothetical protein
MKYTFFTTWVPAFNEYWNPGHAMPVRASKIEDLISLL